MRHSFGRVRTFVRMTIGRRVLRVAVLVVLGWTLAVACTAAGGGAATRPDMASESSGTREPVPTDNVQVDARRPSGRVLVVVGSPMLNVSEQLLIEHLEDLDFNVDVVDDDALDRGRRAVDLIVVSKTVQSETVGQQLNDAAAGVLLWEDNLQRRGLMGLVMDDGSGGTAWHNRGTSIVVEPGVPVEITERGAGPVTLYDAPDEITYGPSPVPSADIVARTADDRAAIYTVEAGRELAVGRAAGRRAYFGLYDDTFRRLTSEGRALFTAIVRWTSS